MGPFARAFGCIIGNTMEYRKDINTYRFKRCELWRGTGMTYDEISEFIKLKGQCINLFGFTSTSIVKSVGMSFQW